MKLEVITQIPKEQKYKTSLLFVHGMWHGAWCWDEFFLPFFADAGYHVTALSLRGHAGSEGKIQGSSIMDYVRDVEEVARTLPTPPVPVVKFLALTVAKGASKKGPPERSSP